MDYTTDPYAGGGGAKSRATTEVRTEVEQFAQRLRDLGATPDEVEPVVATWDDLEPDDTPAVEGEPPPWTAERRTALVSAPDAELEGLIAAARDEFDYSTTDEATAADREKRARLGAEQSAAADVIGSSVAAVLEWVDGDPDRAALALELETAPDAGAGRKTLVGPLTELLEAQEASEGASGGIGTPEAVASAPGPLEPTSDTPSVTTAGE